MDFGAPNGLRSAKRSEKGRPEANSDSRKWTLGNSNPRQGLGYFHTPQAHWRLGAGPVSGRGIAGIS